MKLRVIEKNVFVSVWCVLECSGNLFASSTLFGKVNTHFYLIDYELHVPDTDVFFLSPFSLFSYFCYQTDYKKENSIEVRTMDVQLLRINFSFEKKKIHANFNIILSFPELSVKWLSLLDDNTFC